MRINKAVKSDAGQYTVRLTNSGGSIQTNATVSIVGQFTSLAFLYIYSENLYSTPQDFYPEVLPALG